jgi:hypothetical protein
MCGLESIGSRSVAGSYENGNEPSGSNKVGDILPDVQLLDSQDRLCSVELISLLVVVALCSIVASDSEVWADEHKGFVVRPQRYLKFELIPHRSGRLYPTKPPLWAAIK